MNETDYIKLCEKESDLILQKIICPYCGYVYNETESIDVGLGSDCEDSIKTKCINCQKDIIVNSNATEVRFWTIKAKDGKNDNK